MEHDAGQDAAGPAAHGEAGTGEPRLDAAARGEAGTGEPRVDAAVRSLGALGELPVGEHPAVFERVHGQLVDVLGELRSGPDQAEGGARGRYRG